MTSTSTNEKSNDHGVQGKSKLSINRNWVRLGTRVYDITNFKHPGGSIINYMEVSHSNYSDAQHVFDQFHLRSARAMRMLKALKSKPHFNVDNDAQVANSDQAMMEDYVKFTKQLMDEGYFEGNWIWTSVRLLELVIIFFIGF